MAPEKKSKKTKKSESESKKSESDQHWYYKNSNLKRGLKNRPN